MLEWLGRAVLAAVFSLCMGVLFNSPVRALPLCLVGGGVARLCRDGLELLGAPLPTATLAAAAVTTLLVLLTSKTIEVGRVALVSAVMPLGATVVIFEAVSGMLHVANANEQQVPLVAAQLVQAMAKSLDILFGIGFGIALGIALFIAIRSVFGDASGLPGPFREPGVPRRRAGRGPPQDRTT